MQGGEVPDLNGTAETPSDVRGKTRLPLNLPGGSGAVLSYQQPLCVTVHLGALGLLLLPQRIVYFSWNSQEHGENKTGF